MELLYNYARPIDAIVNFEIPATLRHIQRLPAIPDAPPAAFDGPTLLEQQYSCDLERWKEEWAQQGLPEVMNEECWNTASQRLSHCMMEWEQDRLDTSDLVDAWATALEAMEQELQQPHNMTQWFFLRWYNEQMRDDMSEWTEPASIEQAERDAYDLATALPLHRILQRKPGKPAAWKCLPPASSCGVAATRHHYSNEIRSDFHQQEDFLIDMVNPRLYQEKERPPMTYIEGPQGEKILIIIHLFSGRRRAWDFHHWVEILSPSMLKGWMVWTLSFDTAVDPKDGNLLGENFNRLLHLAASGTFIATMGGPPCETFSPARHLEKPAEIKGFWPRPLRSSSRLWGLESLSMREIEQLRVGSKLYIHNSLLDLQIVLVGGYSLLEHPADPCEDPKASSWQSSFHRVYAAALPGCTPIRINQWKYGAESVKPTVIRAMGGKCAKAELLRHQDHSLPFPSKRLFGIDSNGQFKTAAAKEYPWLLSRSLASALLAEVADGVQTRPLRCLSHASLGRDFQWLQHFACKSSRIDANATFLPDYQG